VGKVRTLRSVILVGAMAIAVLPAAPAAAQAPADSYVCDLGDKAKPKASKSRKKSHHHAGRRGGR
jgi:hypothetical protein